MSKRTKGRVAALAGETTKNFYDLSLAVKKDHDEDPDNFKRIWKEKVLDRRTAYYLLDVGKLIEVGNLSKADAHAIGWTKLQAVARHLMKAGPPEEEAFRKFIDLAIDKKMTARDLPKVLAGNPAEKERAAVFWLSEGEQSRLEAALVANGAKRVHSGLTGKGKALMKIVRAGSAAKR